MAPSRFGGGGGETNITATIPPLLPGGPFTNGHRSEAHHRSDGHGMSGMNGMNQFNGMNGMNGINQYNNGMNTNRDGSLGSRTGPMSSYVAQITPGDTVKIRWDAPTYSEKKPWPFAIMAEDDSQAKSTVWTICTRCQHNLIAADCETTLAKMKSDLGNSIFGTKKAHGTVKQMCGNGKCADVQWTRERKETGAASASESRYADEWDLL